MEDGDHVEPVSYVRRCRIPAHFLAEGRLFVLAAISSVNPTVVHAMETDVVSFQVVDRTQGEGARGDSADEMPGVVRPLLPWTIEDGDGAHWPAESDPTLLESP